MRFTDAQGAERAHQLGAGARAGVPADDVEVQADRAVHGAAVRDRAGRRKRSRRAEAEEELSDAEQAELEKAEKKTPRQPAATRKAESEIVEKQSARELFDYVLNEGKKDYTVQRYKGLGEMTAEQLWETTMDPERRTLLR